jgi:hypothetical protein
LVVKSGNGSPVDVVDNSQFVLGFEERAQNDLAALFISNVVGRSQFALNLNIASAGVTLAGKDANGNVVPFATSPIGGAISGTIKQVNTGIQFRGTPLVGSTGVTGNVNLSVNHQNQ